MKKNDLLAQLLSPDVTHDSNVTVAGAVVTFSAVRDLRIWVLDLSSSPQIELIREADGTVI